MGEKVWIYISNNTKVHLDYIIMNKKGVNSALNCKAHSSFEGVSSNYRIVSVKIRLSLRRNKKQSKSYVMTGPHLPIEIFAINLRQL